MGWDANTIALDISSAERGALDESHDGACRRVGPGALREHRPLSSLSLPVPAQNPRRAPVQARLVESSVLRHGTAGQRRSGDVSGRADRVDEAADADATWLNRAGLPPPAFQAAPGFFSVSTLRRADTLASHGVRGKRAIAIPRERHGKETESEFRGYLKPAPPYSQGRP